VAAAEPTPARVGSWQLLHPLGGGPLTQVYLARPIGLSDSQSAAYAIKVQREKWQKDSGALAILAHEVQVARAVTHPHIVPILAASLDAPPYYLAMPYFEGTSLTDLLAGETLLDLPAIFWIARQVATGLAALAEAEWLHGDVKPSNILVAPSGHTTLIDLGFAAPTSEPMSVANRPVLGTINYIAPEMLYSSLGGDSQSDVYSLGVTLFEMLTGRLPFDAEDVAELALQHRQEVPGDVRSFVPHVPTRGARLVHQMLAKDPMRRPTPAELVQRLMALEIETFAERCAIDATELDEAAEIAE